GSSAISPRSRRRRKTPTRNDPEEPGPGASAMNPGSKEHWESVYRQKGPSDVSWYRPHLDRSLAYLDAARLPPDAAILDVGGGASTFVDDLLDRGYTNVSVLDLSQTALEVARKRLGAARDRVP